MRAFELTEQLRPIAEGGNVFPDVGVIHIVEVEPTLKAIAKLIGRPEAIAQALGSVGKTEYSGDIDIALNLSPEEIKALFDRLQKKLGQDSVKMVSGTLILRFPIVNYDESKQERQPRTGLVQVDLMPGDVDWLRTFFHSPGAASKYKGTHRNVALATVAALLDVKASKKMDDQERPVTLERWRWSKVGGLQKVRKTGIKNKKTGKWLKKQNVEVLTDPVRDPDEIARILFKGKAGAEALNSLESIIEAVKKAYTKKAAEAFFERIAWSLGTAGLTTGLPPEIEKYT